MIGVVGASDPGIRGRQSRPTIPLCHASDDGGGARPQMQMHIAASEFGAASVALVDARHALEKANVNRVIFDFTRV